MAEAPGFEDPLVLTAIGASCSETHEASRRYERAWTGFKDPKHSKYRAYPRFFLDVQLASRVENDRQRLEALGSDALDKLQQALGDSSIGPDDQAEMAEILLNGWGSTFFYHYQPRICEIARGGGKSCQWLSLLLDGQYQINEAWRSRGGGYANTVTEQGWTGFREHLASARKSLTKAWHLRPDLPQAPARMIYVALGDSGVEEMRLWFDRALDAQIDYPDAWIQMRWGLRPRWYGNLEAMLALGVTAVKTRRFDTDVPRKIMDSVSDVASESQLAPGEHIYGRSDIWPYLQQMYEGYIGAITNAYERDGWRGAYAVVAYFAGKYDVSRTQLETLDWKPHPVNLTGWGCDLSLLPLEVAARTSSASDQVEEAETLYRQASLGQCASAYERLSSAAGVDERTRRFIHARLASLAQEQRLAKGDWIEFLPGGTNDPAWICQSGECQYPMAHCVDIVTGGDGSFCYSRTRIGTEFEVRGEFEVVRTSNKSFQAGLVMGGPDFYSGQWQAFRMKHNEAEGEVASFSQGWTKTQVSRAAHLNPQTNSFAFRLDQGRATAVVNGETVFSDVQAPGKARPRDATMLLGLGAYHDSNEVTIRYRNLQVRLLPASHASE